MLFTMRVLVALALCLCFIAPSPVLSFTMPEEKFVENKMADVGEEGTGQNNINSVRFRPHSIPRHLFWLLKLKVQITKSFNQPFSTLLLVSFLIITFIFLFSYDHLPDNLCSLFSILFYVIPTRRICVILPATEILYITCFYMQYIIVFQTF